MKKVMVIGAGPAGLMAAEVLSAAGVQVHVYDAMPSVGRKFLLAGKGGLNLTHSEPLALFTSRFGTHQAQVAPWLQDFGPEQVRAWAQSLGVDTFIGTSGRIFPTDMKAAPLLRAWLARLRQPCSGAAAVQFHMRHRWTGWDSTGTQLYFETPQGQVHAQANAVILALGGASWARLGSDGAWVALLQSRGVAVAPLLPSNCGFDVLGGWSAHFSTRFAGQPFKSVAIAFTDEQGQSFHRKGEFVATVTGVEGGLIYAASSLLRNEIARCGHATFTLDLLPDRSLEKVLTEVRHPRGARSLSSHLKSRLHIDGIKMGILHELLDKTQICDTHAPPLHGSQPPKGIASVSPEPGKGDATWGGSVRMRDPAQLAGAIKALPVCLSATRPMDEAISTAGGVRFDAVNAGQMLTQLPGVFVAGEMLDWEAPTGGYLLTACLASGRTAGAGVLAYLMR